MRESVEEFGRELRPQVERFRCVEMDTNAFTSLINFSDVIVHHVFGNAEGEIIHVANRIDDNS